MEDPMISIHFYAPALKDLGGLLLYDEKGSIYELNENAPSASIHLDPKYYSSIRTGQFEMRSCKNQRSHSIHPVLPKPSSKAIKNMLNKYYGSQARIYDSDEISYRKEYVSGINRILIEELGTNHVERVLDIASGTGARAMAIRSEVDNPYTLYAVEMNPFMQEQAKEKELNSLHGDWLDIELEENSFDTITWLYAFGHIPNYEERIEALEKIHRTLKPGAAFYFDVFNLNDPNEWGINALRVFRDYNLDYFGYERGDVFYKKKGSDELAFLHYFDEKKLIALLESMNFKIDWVKHIGYMQASGKELNSEEGCIFIKALKI